MRRAAVAAVLLSVAFLLDAQSVIVSTVSSDTLTTPPRSPLTIALRLSNTGTEAVRADLDVSLPDGWRQLVSHASASLEPATDSARIVSLFVPQEARAGDYAVTVAVVDADAGTKLHSVAINVRVLPSLELRLDGLDGSTLVVAGEQILHPFRLANQSNTPLAVDLDPVSRSNYPVRLDGIDEQPLLLQPGESRRIVAVVQTPEEVGRIEAHQIVVVATGRPDEVPDSVKATFRASTQIIPAVSEEPVALNTVPARLGLSTTHAFSDEWQGTLRASFSGGGHLDAAARRRIDFLLTPSVALHEPGFGSARDIYRVNYEGEHLEVMLGDNRYAVSPLLGSTVSGRGVFARSTLAGFRLGGLAYYPKTEDPSESTLGALFDYSLADPSLPEGYSYRAAVNVLSRPDDYLVLGTHHRFRPSEFSSFETEIALGANAGEQFAPAMMAGVSGSVSGVDVEGSARFGMPGYPGQFGDRVSLTGAAGTYVGATDTRVTANALYDQRNLQRSAELGSRFRTVSVGLGTRIPLGLSSSSLTVGLRYRDRRDIVEDPSLHQRVGSITTSTRMPLGSVRLGLGTSHDLEHDLLVAGTTLAHRYSISAGLGPGSTFAPTVTLALFDRRGELGTNSGAYTFALSAQQRHGRLSTVFRTSASLYTIADAPAEVAATLSNSTDLKVRRSHTLSVKALVRWAWTPSGRALSGQITAGYTIPLRVPVSRPRNVGDVVGRVYDSRTGDPSAGVVIRLAGRAVVSGSDGQFRFSGLGPGEYHLQIDASRVVTGLIPDMPVPVIVRVEPDAVTQLEIPLVRSASVSGRVSLYAVPEYRAGRLQTALAASNGEYDIADLSPAGGLARVVVVLRNGDEVRRVLTNRDGRFDFSDLRPGEWTASLSATQIPRFHRVVQSEFTIDLSPGEVVRLRFDVVPVPRPITLLQSATAPLQIDLPPAEPPPGRPRSNRLLEMAVQRYSGTDPQAPQLLGLHWGADREAVQAVLSRRGLQVRMPEDPTDELFIAELETAGTLFREYHGRVRLICLDPLSDRSQLFLVAVSVWMDGSHNGVTPARMEMLFEEMLELSMTRWRPRDVRDERVAGIRSVSFAVSDVQISFTFDSNEAVVGIRYADQWHQDAIRDILEMDVR